MFSFVTLRRNARLRILLLYVFIIIKKNGFFYLFMFSKPVIMLKATSHANPKRKTRPGSLLTRTCFSFWIYTATAVHEVDAVRLRMCMAQFHGVLYVRALFSILRTPLTLIISPLEGMMKETHDERKLDQLKLMHRNALRLLNLVNQLLDFRKNEVAGLHLNLSEGEVVSYVHSICNSFLMLSEKKNVHLTFFFSESIRNELHIE